MGFFDSLITTFSPSGVKTRVEPRHATFSWGDDSIPVTVILTCMAKEAREITRLNYKLTMQGRETQDSHNSSETITVLEGSTDFSIRLEPGQSVTEQLVVPLASAIAEDAGLPSGLSQVANMAQRFFQKRNQEYSLGVAPSFSGRKGLSYRSALIRSRHM